MFTDKQESELGLDYSYTNLTRQGVHSHTNLTRQGVHSHTNLGFLVLTVV